MKTNATGDQHLTHKVKESLSTALMHPALMVEHTTKELEDVLPLDHHADHTPV
jgi:hypothetical protein